MAGSLFFCNESSALAARFMISQNSIQFCDPSRLGNLHELEGAVHLWLLDFDLDAEPAPVYLRLLDDAELSRAGAFRHAASRNRFVLCRAWLRILAGAYSGCIPSALRFSTNRYGKPFLDGSRIHFNLAHSGSMAALAFGLDHPLGVDVEFIRTLHDLDGIVRNYFSTRESEVVLGLTGVERVEAFFRGWSGKESVLKADGRGLSLAPESVEVLAAGHQLLDACQVRAENGMIDSWQLRSFHPGASGFGCIAHRSASDVIRGFRLNNVHSGIEFAIS